MSATINIISFNDVTNPAYLMDYTTQSVHDTTTDQQYILKPTESLIGS